MSASADLKRFHESPTPPAPTSSPSPLQHLTDREVIAALIGQDLPPGVLAAGWPDNLLAVLQIDDLDLARAFGLSEEAARRLGAAAELHKRLVATSAPHRPVIRTAADIATVMVPFHSAPVASLYCLSVSSRGRLLHAPQEVSRGDTVSCDLAARPLFRLAVVQGAAAVFAVIVRPDPLTEVTAEDMAAVRRIVAAGRAVDVLCRDVVIFGPGEGNWISVRQVAAACFA